MAMSEDFQLEPSSDDDEFEQVLKIFGASYSRIAKEKGEKTIISVMINEFMRKNGYEKLTAVTVEYGLDIYLTERVQCVRAKK